MTGYELMIKLFEAAQNPRRVVDLSQEIGIQTHDGWCSIQDVEVTNSGMIQLKPEYELSEKEI